MARYRLRFLLQEFDLPRGVTVIGRSLDCNLTIEDPLVSRQHARIAVDDEGGVVEDLGSRNGVRVNGVAVHGPTRLRDGDRVRIGTQEFVFCRVDPAGKSHSKTTGVLRLCANCRLPYPREMIACPNCEATEQTDESTLSGSFGTESQTAWNVQLLLEAVDRAFTLGRIADAERIVRRAIAQVEEVVAAGSSVDPKALASLSVKAIATTLATNDPTWGIWIFDVYRRIGRVPPLEVIERLWEVIGKHSSTVRASLVSLIEHFHRGSLSASSTDVEALSRLEQMRRLLDDTSHGNEITGEWPGPS